jgi:hypothetical protein
MFLSRASQDGRDNVFDTFGEQGNDICEGASVSLGVLLRIMPELQIF